MATQQVGHLAIDDDGVEALLAAEVLVDDRLRDAGLGGDLLDADRLEALLGEQPPADVEQLLAPLLPAHAHALARWGAAWLGATDDVGDGRDVVEDGFEGRGHGVVSLGPGFDGGVVAAHPPGHRGVLELGDDALGLRPADIVGQSGALHAADQQGAQVELVLQHAMACGRRLGVMQAVPGLAERRDGQPPDVRRQVA